MFCITIYRNVFTGLHDSTTALLSLCWALVRRPVAFMSHVTPGCFCVQTSSWLTAKCSGPVAVKPKSPSLLRLLQRLCSLFGWCIPTGSSRSFREKRPSPDSPNKQAILVWAVALRFNAIILRLCLQSELGGNLPGRPLLGRLWDCVRMNAADH